MESVFSYWFTGSNQANKRHINLTSNSAFRDRQKGISSGFRESSGYYLFTLWGYYRFVSGSQDISGWKENVLRDIEEEIQDFSLYIHAYVYCTIHMVQSR